MKLRWALARGTETNSIDVALIGLRKAAERYPGAKQERKYLVPLALCGWTMGLTESALVADPMVLPCLATTSTISIAPNDGR